MQLSQILSRLMSERQISAYKISKETGISDRLIGYWKKGEKLPGAENLIILANYFGISVDFLLGLEEQKLQINEFNSYSASNALDNQQQKLLDNYNKLNIPAQKALVQYSDYMITQSDNLKDTPDTDKRIS